MINKLDHLIVCVNDIAEAEKKFTKLFGIKPAWRGEHKELGTTNCIFNFSNTYFELLSAREEGPGADLVRSIIDDKGEGLAGLVLGVEDIHKAKQQIVDKGFDFGNISHGQGKDFDNHAVRKWNNLFLPRKFTRGLFSFLIEHTEGHLPYSSNFPDSSISKLDHVVINTNDPDGLIAIYEGIYGLRLALDQTVEKWGGRMLFFRVNKTTIEVIAKADNKAPEDKLWGMAWEVENLEKTHRRISEEGLEITDIKDGRKPNTLVATVKSDTYNIPTLLIQHLPS